MRVSLAMRALVLAVVFLSGVLRAQVTFQPIGPVEFEAVRYKGSEVVFIGRGLFGATGGQVIVRLD